MNGMEYQTLAMRTNDGKATQRLDRLIDSTPDDRDVDVGGVLNGCLGLSGEVGEFNDMVKKWIFHEKDLDMAALEKIGPIRRVSTQEIFGY